MCVFFNREIISCDIAWAEFLVQNMKFSHSTMFSLAATLRTKNIKTFYRRSPNEYEEEENKNANKTTIEIWTPGEISEKAYQTTTKTTKKNRLHIESKWDPIQITSKSTLYNNRILPLSSSLSPFENVFTDFSFFFRFHILSSWQSYLRDKLKN